MWSFTQVTRVEKFQSPLTAWQGLEVEGVGCGGGGLEVFAGSDASVATETMEDGDWFVGSEATIDAILQATNATPAKTLPIRATLRSTLALGTPSSLSMSSSRSS